MKNRIEQENQKKLAEQQLRGRLPFVSLALTGGSIAVYYCWQTWNHRRSRTNFIFTETNFYNLKNYHSLLLSPISFENNFFFYTSLPGLLYSSTLIERYLGYRVLIGSYIANCLVSAATTVYVHRQIGFHKVQQRGRISNSNGNATLFLSCLFGSFAPGYRIHRGKHLATTIFFYYLVGAYLLLYFTSHLTDAKSQFKHATNHNETHYSAVVTGTLLGLLLRSRIR